MTAGLLEQLFAHVRERHPRTVRGLEEARTAAPDAFDLYGETYLGWAAAALEVDEPIPRLAEAFERFTTELLMAQARYERDGRYEQASASASYATLYAQRERMTEYLWGSYLTNVLWAHHVEMLQCFDERFLPRLDPTVRILELASGHGGWGVWALHRLPGATLRGYDISPSAIALARRIAAAAGVQARAAYAVADALQLPEAVPDAVGALICCFLVEHLETPARLFAVAAERLGAGGLAFVTGALTAAQEDHVYEFRRESELVLLAEAAGFRVLETLSTHPRRTLQGARFLPRSMALILQKRGSDTW